MSRTNEFSRKLRDLLADPVFSRTDLAEMFSRQYTSEAITKIVDIMRNPETPQALQLKCALELLSRAWGKPAVAIRVSSDQKDKEDAQRFIEGELEEAEKASRQIMEMAKLGGLSPDLWFSPDSKFMKIVDNKTSESIKE